jgi:hypothetical protein
MNTINNKYNEQTNLLKLVRFCGDEYFPIIKATWFINKCDEFDELWFEIEAMEGTVLCEDTKQLNGKPNWQLTCVIKKLDRNDLKTGFMVEIPNGYDEKIDDTITNFYYCEHQQTDNNLIEILETDGEKLYARITGETMDVNYYDGSKPNNKIIVETWFEYGNIMKI